MTVTCLPITPVCAEQIESALTFIHQARAQMFPKLHDAPLPADLADFAGTYLAPAQGRLLLAHDGDRLVGCVGHVPYDHRFAQLDYRGRRTVEVVRLFVDPRYRRLGLAARLVAALRAQAQGVEVLYLHTHPFLPGAIEFWQRQGFAVVDVEADPVWRTTHMACLL